MGKEFVEKNPKIELVSVTVKINGKTRLFKKEALSFHGWEAECDCCGTHGGADMTIYDKKKVHKVELESY